MWSVYQMLSLDDNIDPETRIKLLDHMSSWMYHNFDNYMPVLDLSGSSSTSKQSTSQYDNHHGNMYYTQTLNKSSPNPNFARQIRNNTPFMHSHNPVSPSSRAAKYQGRKNEKSSQVVSQQHCGQIRQQIRQIKSSPLRDISNTQYKSHWTVLANIVADPRIPIKRGGRPPRWCQLPTRLFQKICMIKQKNRDLWRGHRWIR